jgi:hypothetical protein
MPWHLLFRYLQLADMAHVKSKFPMLMVAACGLMMSDIVKTTCVAAAAACAQTLHEHNAHVLVATPTKTLGSTQLHTQLAHLPYAGQSATYHGAPASVHRICPLSAGVMRCPYLWSTS